MSPPSLAWRVEALRFAQRFGLDGAPRDLSPLVRRLLRLQPEHPVSLSLRAEHALPETALPPPEPALREVAVAFRERRLDEALEHVRQLPSPRARVVEGDLLLALNRPTEAAERWTEAARALGPLPPLLTRAARAALYERRPERALALSAEALTANPLLGSARVVRAEAAEVLNKRLLPVPLSIPSRDPDGVLKLPSSLPPTLVLGWRAWLRDRELADGRALPPGLHGLTLLVRAWRRTDPAPSAEDPAVFTPKRLTALDEAGLLEAYAWSTGLTPTNAPGFRDWSLRHAERLRALWTEEAEAAG